MRLTATITTALTAASWALSKVWGAPASQALAKTSTAVADQIVTPPARGFLGTIPAIAPKLDDAYIKMFDEVYESRQAAKTQAQQEGEKRFSIKEAALQLEGTNLFEESALQKRQTPGSVGTPTASCLLRNNPSPLIAQAGINQLIADVISKIVDKTSIACTRADLAVAGNCNGAATSDSASVPTSQINALMVGCKPDGTPIVCASFYSPPCYGLPGNLRGPVSLSAQISAAKMENILTNTTITFASTVAKRLTNFEAGGNAGYSTVSSNASNYLSSAALWQVCDQVAIQCLLEPSTKLATSKPTTNAPANSAQATNATEAAITPDDMKAIEAGLSVMGLALVGVAIAGGIVLGYIALRKKPQGDAAQTNDDVPLTYQDVDTPIEQSGVFKMAEVLQYESAGERVYIRVVDNKVLTPQDLEKNDVVYCTRNGQMLNFQEVRSKNEATYAKVQKPLTLKPRVAKPAPAMTQTPQIPQTVTPAAAAQMPITSVDDDSVVVRQANGSTTIATAL